MTASPGPSLDLSRCDLEPIHVPGHIQPHGVLFATDPDSLRITHVSANVQASTGLSPDLILGRDLSEFLGPPAFAVIEAELLSGRHGPSSTLRADLPLRMGSARNIMAHRCQRRVVVELEPASEVDGASVAMTQRVIARLSDASTVEELCQVAAETVRNLTGYDRVMIYRFDPEGHGTVVTEEKAAELEPYLGLRYPASDIPQQARRLYVSQRLRTIPDVDYAAVGLMATPDQTSDLDMSFSVLRGVSPVHLQYLRNMGVGATMAISLLRESELWGMIVCHHRRPMAPDAHLRGLCGLIGQMMSVLLHRASDAATLADRLKRYHIITALQASLETAENVAVHLSRQETALLGLMGASGAMVTVGGGSFVIGAAPPRERALAMMAALRRDHGDDIVAVDDAGRPGGLAGDCPALASGILMMPILNNPDDAIAWFRPEQLQTVRWGGDPHKAVLPGPTAGILSPRTSFAAWAEVVHGRSEPWTTIDVDAAQELRRMIMGVLLSHAEAQLAHLSAFDPLTTLANRRTLKSWMDVCATDRAHPSAAMLFVDLDRFKAINDFLGHVAGDQVLIEVAARLRRLTPEGAMAGRLGGDEFVLFWPGGTEAEATRLASLILETIAEPVVVAGQAIRINASIGVAWSDVGELDRLMSEADEAMYATKRRGGSAVSVYHPVLHAKPFNSMLVEQELFRALEEEQITVHFQPVYRVSDLSLMGFEALARWRHPGRGWIPPTDFIPVAEASGLITRLGARVMAIAVRQIGQWLALDAGLRMSVNVSALQLVDESLVELTRDLLARERVRADRVFLEVTESVMMKEAAVAQLHRLRAMGVGISLDDFGTGYSSLAYLQDLPVDVVKVDRKFVTPLGSAAKADRVFEAVVNLAQTLGLRLIAEGCETEDQLRVIRASGCEGVQGWLLGMPGPPEEIALSVLARP